MVEAREWLPDLRLFEPADGDPGNRYDAAGSGRTWFFTVRVDGAPSSL